MRINIPLNSGGLAKTTDAGSLSLPATSAAQLQAKVTLARLPEQVMRLQPQSGNALEAFHVKVPSSFSFDDKAQHQLARTSSSTQPKSVLIEHTHSTQRTVVTPEQANRIAETVSRAMPANATLPTGSIQATVVHTPTSQISLKLALPGNPVVNIALNQTVNLTQGDKVQLTLSQITANELKISITSIPANNAIATEIKLSPQHILAQQFTKLQLANGLSVSPQLLQAALDKAGLTAIQPEGSAPVNVLLRNNKLTTLTTLSQPIAQVTLSKTATKALPILPYQANVKSLPQLLPFEPLLSPTKNTLVTNSQPLSTSPVDTVNKQQIHNAIMQLSRHLLNETGSTREALSQLVATLSTPNSVTSTSTISLLRSLTHQLTQGFIVEESGSVKGTSQNSGGDSPVKPQTVQALQTLFTSPSLPVSSQTLISPVTQPGFVSALVAILQMTFAGRAIRNQPHLAAYADDSRSFLSKSMTQLGATGSPAKVTQEFSRLDGQRQILDNIKTLLANHRQHKLTNVDNRLQGQESFYFVLPVNSQNQAPPEVLLKREEPNTNEKDAAETADKVWNFTMKLVIDELGKLLVKSKVSPTTLELNLYASTDTLLNKVTETMPTLLKRLTALGLTVEHSSCQRGKIPETLSDNPYQLFETHA